jgi:hypothetical protein
MPRPAEAPSLPAAVEARGFADRLKRMLETPRG